MSTEQQLPHSGVSASGRTFQVVGTVLPIVSLFCVLLRTAVRWSSFKRLYADDWAIIGSQVLAFGFIIESNLWAEKYGLGWTEDTLPMTQIQSSLKTFYAFELNWAISTFSYKLAVLLLYQRIFGAVRPFKIALYIAAGLAVVWFTGALFVTIFQCVPLHAIWTPSEYVTSKCIDGQAFCFGTGITNVLVDSYILAIPIVMVWKLHLPSSKKAALTGLFLLGGFVVVAGILRVTSLSHADAHNLTGTLVEPCCWSVVEPCVGIISACLPTLPRLLFKSKADPSEGKRTYESRQEKTSEYNESGGTSKRNSKKDARSLGMALQGWNSEAYTEIGDSSGPQSSRMSTHSDVEQQSPMTPAPFDPDHIKVATAWRVQHQLSTTDLPRGRSEDV